MMVLSLCDSKMATYCMKRTLQNQIHASSSQLFVAGILPHLTTSISVQLCCFKCCAPEMLRSSLHKKSPNLSLWACSKLSLHLLFFLFFFFELLHFHESPILCEFSDVMASTNISARCDCRHRAGS